MTEEEKELRACYHWTEWERKAKQLEEENNKLLDVINNQDVKIADLEQQIEEMKKKLNVAKSLIIDLCNNMVDLEESRPKALYYLNLGHLDFDN